MLQLITSFVLLQVQNGMRITGLTDLVKYVVSQGYVAWKAVYDEGRWHV